MNDTPRMTRVSMGQSFGPIVQAIIDEGMKLERELALANSACDSWRKLAMDRRDKIAKLEAENEWHPASEPPDSPRIVLLFRNKGRLAGWWSGEKYIAIIGSDSSNVTHWREMPTPPKGAT